MATPPQRVLWIRTDRLGETVLNLPAAAAMKAGRPGSSLTLLVQAPLAPLFRLVGGIDEVVACPEKGSWWIRAARLARWMRTERFDAVVVSNPKKEWHAAAWLAGVPVRVGYDRKWSWCLTHRVPDRKEVGGRHEVDWNVNLVRVLAVPSTAPAWPMFEFGTERDEVAHLLAAQGIGPAEFFVAVHPWTSNPAKRWPAVRFKKLLVEMARRFPQQAVVLIGGAEEVGGVPDVLPSRGGRIVNLVGRVSLPQLAALLGRARVLVSNDSGPVHLAAAVKTPTIVLFGSAHPATGPARWGPWGAGHTVICRPTMESIAFEDVMTALVPFLHE